MASFYCGFFRPDFTVGYGQHSFTVCKYLCNIRSFCFKQNLGQWIFNLCWDPLKPVRRFFQSWKIPAVMWGFQIDSSNALFGWACHYHMLDNSASLLYENTFYVLLYNSSFLHGMASTVKCVFLFVVYICESIIQPISSICLSINCSNDEI